MKDRLCCEICDVGMEGGRNATNRRYETISEPVLKPRWNYVTGTLQDAAEVGPRGSRPSVTLTYENSYTRTILLPASLIFYHIILYHGVFRLSIGPNEICAFCIVVSRRINQDLTC